MANTCGITNNGITLLEQATATANKIILKEVYAFTTKYVDDIVLNQSLSWFIDRGPTQDVQARVISNTSGRVVVELVAQSEEINIKTVVISAQLEINGVLGTKDTFMVWTSDEGITLSDDGGLKKIVQLAFNYKYDRATNITVNTSEPAYLLTSEGSRFVSCVGVDNTGEAQTIQGVKTFRDMLVAYNGINTHMIEHDDCIELNTQSTNITLSENENMITGAAKDVAFYVQDEFRIASREDEIDLLKVSEDLQGMGELQTYKVYAPYVNINCINGYDSSNITLAGNIIPSTNYTYNLGSTSNKFGNIYAKYLTSESLYTTNVIASATVQGETVKATSKCTAPTIEATTAIKLGGQSIRPIIVSNGIKEETGVNLDTLTLDTSRLAGTSNQYLGKNTIRVFGVKYIGSLNSMPISAGSYLTNNTFEFYSVQKDGAADFRPTSTLGYTVVKITNIKSVIVLEGAVFTPARPCAVLLCLVDERI